MKDILRRQQALERTKARFAGKPFKLGRNDCVQLARFHLRAMGHSKLPKTGSYSTAVGARRALKAAGFESLEAALDSILKRIPAAAVLPGDILVVPGEESQGGEALMISLGRKFLGFHEDASGLAVLEPLIVPNYAWRA